jgi:hypothetical protein
MTIFKPILLLFCAAVTLRAHFTFIVPLPGRAEAHMVLSETLTPDDAVSAEIAAGAKIKVRDASGKEEIVELIPADNHFKLKLPGKGNRIAYGTANLGIANRGGKTHLLLYYPKTIVGSLYGKDATVGGDQVVELVPHGEPGRIRIQLIARGKPVPAAEFTLIHPNGKQQIVKTDAEGFAGPFTESGRYGAWARFWENSPGEQEGKPYEQLRHYAMLVFDAHTRPETALPLPEKTSSFGAVLHDGWLYVYGGHIARTHSYSIESVSGKFSRMKIDGSAWEELPSGMPLQGTNLAAYDGNICRVGGMAPRNKPGEPADTQSVSDVSCFNLATRAWKTLPPLPEPRSSHDVVVIGDRLIVTGGWNLRGRESDQWSKTSLVLNLKNPDSGWTAISQPFQRRALVTAVHRDKMFVIGGITPSGAVSTEVDIYDPQSNIWSKAPALPGAEINGFAPAAAIHRDRLYVSVGDGSLYRLDEPSKQWVEAGVTTPRLAHRMVSTGDALLIAGGAVKGNNLDLVERIAPQP